MTTDTDAAQRIADTYNTHRVADLYGNIGRWFAARLTDGVSNGELYDTKTDAMRSQVADEKYYLYVQITPGQMSVKDARTYLAVMRRAYDKGLRLGERDIIKRVTERDQYRQLRALFRGDLPPTNIQHGSN